MLPAALTLSRSAHAQAPVEHKLLCDAECEAQLSSYPTQTLKSGVKIVDIKEGDGLVPKVGYQVVLDYVAKTPKGQIFDSSLDKGRPYDIRLGTGMVVMGLDEGLKGMKTGGGIRRIYIPGNLAFPKGLASAPGTPRIPPNSPLVFDVQMLYCPGLDE